MQKRIRLMLALVLSFTLAFGVAAMPVAAAVEFSDRGPNVDEIIMPIIKEQTARRIAFERGGVFGLALRSPPILMAKS